MDTGPGLDKNFSLNDQIVLSNLNIMTLEKNLSVKDLKLGIPLS